jgi:hypothetical protein
MLTFTEALRVVESLLHRAPGDHSLGLHTSVRFDPNLQRNLLAQHDALNARFSEAVGKVESDGAQACSAIRDCATQLHRLRRAEAVWLHPVIAAGIDGDAAARGQFMQLRIVLLANVRAVLREFDNLSQAIENGSATQAHAGQVATALAAFLRRCAAEIYPLYDLIGTLQPVRAVLMR